MRGSSLAVLAFAATLVSACHSERLTGPAAQDAVRHARSMDVSRFGGALIFVDGKEVTDSIARALDPQNIDTVEVIKGKWAAERYGAGAGGGVILITTKAGKSAAGR